MNKKNRIILIILVSAVFLSGIISAFFFLYKPKPSEPFSKILASLDDSLEIDSYKQFKNDVGRIIKQYPLKSNSWLSLLKRAYIYAGATEDYAFLTELSEKAHKDFPGNKEINFIFIYSLMRSNRYQEASERINRLSVKDYAGFRSEIATGLIISRGSGVYQPEFADPIITTFSSEKPETFIEAGKITGDRRFFLNAGLLCMKAGHTEEAMDLIKQGFLEPWPETALLISYDSGNLTSAQYYLQVLYQIREYASIPHKLLSADILYLLADYSGVLEMYLSLLQEDPEVSWLAYYNSAWVYVLKKDYKLAIDLLERALLFYPDNTELILFLANCYSVSGKRSEAVKILTEHQKRQGSDIRAVFALSVLNKELNRQRFESEIWNILSRKAEEKEEVYRYFARYLLDIRSYSEVFNVLDKAELEYPGKSWVSFLRGIAYAATDQKDKSIESFIRSNDLLPGPEGYYNIGILYKQNRDYAKAEESLYGSLELAKNATDQIKSSIYSQLALLFFETGRNDAAERHIQYALDLYPHNLEALMLKRNLAR